MKPVRDFFFAWVEANQNTPPGSTTGDAWPGALGPLTDDWLTQAHEALTAEGYSVVSAPPFPSSSNKYRPTRQTMEELRWLRETVGKDYYIKMHDKTYFNDEALAIDYKLRFG